MPVPVGDVAGSAPALNVAVVSTPGSAPVFWTVVTAEMTI